MHQNTRQSVRSPLYIAIALCVGVFIGANMASSSSASTSTLVKNAQKFRQVLTHIENDYVDQVNTDDLVEGVISGVLKELDPHSAYIPPEDFELVKSDLEGNYEGIGIEFNIFKDTIFVVTPLSGGPSEKLGVRTRDKIIKVNGENVAGVEMTNRKVVELLRGERGSKVVISIFRKGEADLMDFNIERDVIPQYSIDVSYMVNEDVGYIKVSRFANSTFLEFKKALRSLKGQGMTKLVLDLTGNPGGYLQRAVQIVDEILAEQKIIVYTDGKEKRYAETHYSSEKGDFKKGRILVMIDEGSASASEIVAGAIQDHDRGLIVGRRSFGKGLVQMPINLIDGSQLRLTISRYYTPSGRSIQKPYNGKSEEYYKESYNRYVNGEVYSQDSIKVSDSLLFKTAKGRIVRGGGGITPDYFVPLDTSQSSTYLNRLFSTNTMQEFTIKYADEHETELEGIGYDKFKKSFTTTDKMLEDLIVSAESNGLKFNREQFQKSNDLVKLLVKAHIARGVWKNQGFYPIFNEQNEIYQKAISLIGEAKDMRIN